METFKPIAKELFEEHHLGLSDRVRALIKNGTRDDYVPASTLSATAAYTFQEACLFSFDCMLVMAELMLSTDEMID